MSRTDQSAEIMPFASKRDNLFDTWLNARNLAMREPTRKNAEAAGVAWAAWQDNFLPPDRRSADHVGKYIPLSEYRQTPRGNR